MKLYNEEQVKDILIDFTTPIGVEYYLSKLTPIELPSDEEIDKESFIINPPKIQNDYGKDDDDNIQYRDEWIGGAKWVIEQIKQQDNDR
jgi:hypothetical protein